MDVGILGGGLSGLSLGYLLDQKGVKFKIIEKEPECGGLMRSSKNEAFTFDFGGSHIIFSKDKDVLNFILNLISDNKIKNKRNTKILYKGHFVKYPFENGLADLPKEDNFECLYEFIKNKIKSEKGELEAPNNLKEWFFYTFGKGIAEKYLIPYNEKIWKYPLDKSSLEWVERIPNPPIEDILKSSLNIETEGYTHQLFFYYPEHGGIETIIKCLEKKISTKVITDFNIIKIYRNNSNKWVISNGNQQFIFDKLISTIPLQELIKVIDYVPQEVAHAVNSLNYNSIITIGLGINKPDINNFSWLYIPDRDVLTHRISFPSNYSSKVTPSGTSSVLAEITCNIGDEIWSMKDDDLIRRTIEDLHKLNLVNKTDVCYTKLTRLKYAYVINDLNYNVNLEIINKYAADIGLDLVGRFAQFKYLNMDDCIRRAMDYVNNGESK